MFKPVKFNLQLPTSKSLTQRAFLLNYLSGSKGQVINPIFCDDTEYLQKALQQKLSGKIYIGNSATAIRFLLPFFKAGSVIDGDKNMKNRPHSDLIGALSYLGIKIKSKEGKLPLKILSRNIYKNKVKINASKSSQFLSSLLMLAPTLPKGLIINVKNKIASKPYIDLTLGILKQYGIKIINKNYHQFIIKNQKIKTIKYQVEADASAASYWLAYNYLSESKINISNLNLKTKQGDNKFIQALEQLKKGQSIFDFNSMPDCVMPMIIAAIFTDRKITIKNIAHLKNKETDRLKALNYNLNKINIKNKIGRDYIKIHGTSGFFKNNIIIKSFNDHRIAMAFAILGLKIDNKKCVTKSYPNFWHDYQKIHDANIIVTGMRGTGKTTLGKKWAHTWNMKFIDLDQEIEKKAKMSISQIVDKKGWQYFRNLEHKIVKKYSKVNNTLIATGGGTLMYARNYNLFKDNYIILLTAEIKTMARRICNNNNLPPLIGKNHVVELEQVWQKRKTKYFSIADQIYQNN